MGERAGIKVASSPWGPDDQLGALNHLSPEGSASILARVDGSKSYDLSIDYFVGMPSFQAAGDPSYQLFMSHTPSGTVVDTAAPDADRLLGEADTALGEPLMRGVWQKPRALPGEGARATSDDG